MGGLSSSGTKRDIGLGLVCTFVFQVKKLLSGLAMRMSACQQGPCSMRFVNAI